MLQLVVRIMHPTSWVHYTTNCNTQSSAPEDGQNNTPKHVEMTGIINTLRTGDADLRFYITTVQDG